MDRRGFISAAGALAIDEGLRLGMASVVPSGGSEFVTAAYYFGNFHVDPRNEKAHGSGWTEWNLVRAASP